MPPALSICSTPVCACFLQWVGAALLPLTARKHTTRSDRALPCHSRGSASCRSLPRARNTVLHDCVLESSIVRHHQLVPVLLVVRLPWSPMGRTGPQARCWPRRPLFDKEVAVNSSGAKALFSMAPISWYLSPIHRLPGCNDVLQVRAAVRAPHALDSHPS